MMLVTIAAYVLFIALIIFFPTKILWLLFLLFCYRFWEMFLPYDKMIEYISFNEPWHYNMMVFILALITYFAVIFLTREMIFLRYIALLIILFFVIQKYEIMDILFFKDYFEAKGMWNIDYWVGQFRDVFKSSTDDKKDIFGKVWEKIKSTGETFWGYIKQL